MKKIYFISLASLAIFLISCDKSISPETAKAFVGEYWMETKRIYTIGTEEFPLNTYSAWTPVSIYEKRGNLYVQTELFGSPDLDNENPKEVEGTRERPNFIAPHKLPAEDVDPEEGGIETIEITAKEGLVCRDGQIVLISHGVLAQTLPIKVKSGSETVLNLEPYNPVVVTLTDAKGDEIQKIHAWYEYGPMVKDGEVIKWEVEFKDDFTPLSGQSVEYDRVVHRNILYKR